ncbi:MAG: hypothetical protein BGO98_34060 [Myxococcales bacterium 68-20]|nr:hypothetical protein [Myxococcales bacterium]OJY25652.1 MAG: hypothetical protein BGO98_34060 [Myxococcales bacterium 68-20]
MADVSRRSEPRLSVMFGRVVAAAALIVPLPARAEAPEVEPITLLYEAETSATSTCPSQGDFFATVRAYTSRWSAVPEGTQAERTFRVRLSVHGDEWLGTLVIANEAGPLAERRLVGPTCAGVARAMAIMVGVAIDLRADGPNDTKAGVDKEPEEPSADGPPNEAPADRPREEPRAERRRDGGERLTAGHPRSSGPTVAFDVRLESTSAVVRGALPGIGASMKLILPPAEEPRWLRGWKPSFGLGLRQSLPKERALSGGSVDFLWMAGNFRACPHELTIARVVEVAPCAEMNLGILRSSAEGFARARQASITWLDLGGSVWAAVHLSKSVFLSSTVLVTAPLVRRPFVLSSGTVAASVPAVGLLGGIGIGLRL